MEKRQSCFRINGKAVSKVPESTALKNLPVRIVIKYGGFAKRPHNLS
jgi:hypothetical protein